MITFKLDSSVEQFILLQFIICPFAFKCWAIIWSIKTFSFSTSVDPIAIIALTTYVPDAALSVSLTIQV